MIMRTQLLLNFLVSSTLQTNDLSLYRLYGKFNCFYIEQQNHHLCNKQKN